MICFQAGNEAVLSALAPTLALSIIGLGRAALGPAGQAVQDIVRALVPVVCTLAQLLVSEIYARRLGRQVLWTRYAAASLWCEWLPLVLMIVVQALLELCLPVLAHTTGSIVGVALGIQCYSLWLTWYITLVGLQVTVLQAGVMTALQTLTATVILVLLYLLPPHYNVLVDMFAEHF